MSDVSLGQFERYKAETAARRKAAHGLTDTDTSLVVGYVLSGCLSFKKDEGIGWGVYLKGTETRLFGRWFASRSKANEFVADLRASAQEATQ